MKKCFSVESCLSMMSIYHKYSPEKCSGRGSEQSEDGIAEHCRRNAGRFHFTIDMMNAYEALGTIIGESVGEDLVNEIFSKFCMGK